jgi:5-methylcytosine-specific restriction endonuclease McrA
VLPPDRVRTVVVPVIAASAPALTLASPDCKESYRRSGGKESASAQAGDAGTSECAAPHTSAPVQLQRHAMLQFSAHESFMTKLTHVRSLASHRLPGNASFEQVFDFLMGYFIEREDPAARHARRETRKPTTERRSPGLERRSRQIPARVRDQVFVRDKQRCAYVGADGRRCGSTHVLQVDHVKPVARGGASTLDNLRLLCAHHNRMEAERLMGTVRRAADRALV